MRTIQNVIEALPHPDVPRLLAPAYRRSSGELRVGLAVESMKRHTTSEGWEIFAGLQSAGYKLHGFGLGETDVGKILDADRPAVVVLQDKREWEGLTAGGPATFDQRERFSDVWKLKDSGCFVATILKDAQHNPGYHRQSADEIGCHAWVVYYHPRIVAHLAPWLRPEHLVRTWHSLDRDLVPPFADRGGPQLSNCVISGAMGRKVYPLRTRLKDELVGRICHIRHPGYDRSGCRTPDYLRTLSQFRAAICTSSVYGYALRKIVEATACGCRVITDLPSDEVMPEIDGNLIRVDPAIQSGAVAVFARYLLETWEPEKQEHWAAKAKAFYDYRAVGRRLAGDIEAMRRGYHVA